jgi:hypothetical protein
MKRSCPHRAFFQSRRAIVALIVARYGGRLLASDHDVAARRPHRRVRSIEVNGDYRTLPFEESRQSQRPATI